MFGFVGGWDEKFLQQEIELKRVRSEKANLEQHILGMESELETMQVEKTRQQEEKETQKRTCSGMEQQIEALMAEVSDKTLKYYNVKSELLCNQSDYFPRQQRFDLSLCLALKSEMS